MKGPGNEAAASRVLVDQSCYEKELTYPGAMPRHPFLMRGEEIWFAEDPSMIAGSEALPISRMDFTGAAGEPVPDGLITSLVGKSAPDRFPVLAFGANRDPSNLLWKFRYRPIEGAVLGFPAEIADAEVVAANVFYSGHFYADLICSGKNCADRVECIVLLLDAAQLFGLHRSEEVPSESDLASGTWRYGALPAWFDVELRGNGDRPLRVIGYASWASAWSPQGDNRPIALSQVAAHGRRVPARTQDELFSSLCSLYFPGEVRDHVLERFRALWAGVQRREQGYKQDWYSCLVAQVREDSVRDDSGAVLTGIDSARERGRLLASTDVWRVPHSCAAQLS